MGRYELTVAMAAYDDFNGVFFSSQALRMYQDMRNVEIVILDNNPDSAEGQATKSYVESVQHNEAIRYVPFKGSIGTTQTREHLFQLAEGDAVLVMDCHVLLQANAIYHLKKFYREASEQQRKDLYTGPLLMDGLNFVMTHFECEWRDQMWGVWATAWKHPDGTAVLCRPTENNKVKMRPLMTDGPWATIDVPWPAHEQQLLSKGYKVMGMDSTDAPFEIPAQGLGLFSSTKEHWLGFNPNFKAFGGEECYIHEKYRQHGRKAMCLPFLKWNHRFGRPGGPKYPLTLEGKIRNYILGFDELGFDREPVRKHFVDEVGVAQLKYDAIAANPIGFDPMPMPNLPVNVPDVQAKSNLGLPLPVVADSFSDVIEFIVKTPRDLDQHVNAFMQWTLGCDSAVEVTKRRESTAFLLGAMGRKVCGGKCQKESCDKQSCNKVAYVTSYQEEGDSLIGLLQDLVKSHTGRPLEFTVSQMNHDTMLETIPASDLLFIDTRHHGERLYAELTAYAPNIAKRILIHDTATFGVKGENDGKGMFWAIRKFIDENPEWFIAEHKDHQYGMTVLSKLPEDKPEELVKPWPKSDKDGKPCGCGQNVKKFLKMIGIEASEGCSCNRRAAVMDQMGPQWCRENIDEILNWLKEEADARNMGHLFIRPAVKLMVMRAIRQAEKDEKSGACS